MKLTDKWLLRLMCKNWCRDKTALGNTAEGKKLGVVIDDGVM